MKNNLKMLYNPFDRVAGWKAFFIGLPIVCATIVLGWLAGTIAFGLEVKVSGHLPLVTCFLYTGVGLACTVVIMYLIGIIFSKGVRFQDILGTVTLARAPYILTPLMGLIMKPSSAEMFAGSLLNGDSISVTDWITFIAMTVFAMVLMVWAIAMLYNAFRISTNLKGAKCVILFIISVIVSEIIMLCIL